MNSQRAHVLIVEDDASFSQTLVRLISARGFNVVVASSMLGARDWIRQGKVGFLISDLGLPDGDGCELMQELRDEWSGQGVAVSGYGMAADKIRAQAAGFALHFTKPIDIHHLEQILDLARQAISDPQL
jgi:DNA-binding response OmpR family regulator